MNELKSMVLFLMDKTEVEPEEVKMPVLSSNDLQLVFKGGYEEIITNHVWPFKYHKKQLFQGGQPMSDDDIHSFFTTIFKQIEDLFVKHVAINQWTEYDPHGKYPMYSLKIYDRNVTKLKKLLFQQCK
jgi:hypothetical protein